MRITRPNHLTPSKGSWTLEGGCNLRRCDSGENLWTYLPELVQGQASGRLVVDQDIGSRPWLLCALLGMEPRRLRGHLALEWSGEAASLTFYNRLGGEYRAKDPECPIIADEKTRRAVACGGEDLGLSLARALRAIEEYLKTGSRPCWLDYEAVA